MPDPVDESPQQQFDSIRQLNPYGEEYWSARELMPLLGYEKWERFEGAIDRALNLCNYAKQDVSMHFPINTKDAMLGKGAIRAITDYHLTRYALFLISVCGDWRKPEITRLQAYLSLAALDQDYLAKAEATGISIPQHLAVTKEQKTIGLIARAFRHIPSIHQFRVGIYYLDLYFPDHRIAVECDEDGHRKILLEAEAERQRTIEQALGCTFVRYNPDDNSFHIGDVINHIMLLVYGSDNSEPSIRPLLEKRGRQQKKLLPAGAPTLFDTVADSPSGQGDVKPGPKTGSRDGGTQGAYRAGKQPEDE